MKFGKHLQKRQLDIPEYAASFVNYKALKKLIKQLSATPTIHAQNASLPQAEVLDAQASLQANKATFFFRLERELEKVNAFYLQKEAELQLRLRTLLDKKRVMQSRSSLASKTSTSFMTLEEGFQQFGNDLNKLQQFVEINATAFSKILKKWDKTSKSKTKELYLSRAVEVQPCFNRDVISHLSDQATTCLLELGAWAEGDKVQYDPNSGATRSASAVDYMVTGQLLGSDESDTDSQLLRATTSGNLLLLREWIARIKGSSDAPARFSRVFLSVITEASKEALGLLLKTNLVDVHAEDEINERNCLHEAAICGRLYILEMGLAQGVNAERADVYGRLPLHYAVIHGHVDMVSTLLKANPGTINHLDHDNFTPLIHGIVHHQVQCVQQLLSHGARIDPEGDSDHVPLNLACQHGSLEIAELLLQGNARIQPDAEGLYPQHLVARTGLKPEAFLLLEQHGADLNQRDKLYQWTPLFHAASEGHVESIQVLLSRGADINILDEKDLSAMFYATWEGHLECMRLISSIDVSHQPRRSSSKPGAGLSTSGPAPMSGARDGIPDLSLPPPIIPLRRYGHNFLDTKTFIQISFEDVATSAIVFYHSSKYPAARLTISSKLSDLIPRNIMLPIQEDSKIISFQVDSLDSFAVDLDIFSTFGSKVIAKTVALPAIFSAVDSSTGRACLPLFDPRLRVIGQISFRFQVIKAFHGIPLEITQFAPYWKATSQDDSHPAALITGSSLSGEYARLCVQLTRDGVPVLFPFWEKDHHGISFPISRLSLEQLHSTTQNRAWRADLLKALQSTRSVEDLRTFHAPLSSSLLPLREVLQHLTTSVNLELHVLYPSASEELRLGHTLDINSFADAILKEVFEHARLTREKAPEEMRSVVFTSYNSGACTALNWKQPNYPVLLCNDLGNRPRHPPSNLGSRDPSTMPVSDGHTTYSVKEAVRIAQTNNFMGLMCTAKLLEMVPALVESIKVAGLVLVVDTSLQEDADDEDSGKEGAYRDLGPSAGESGSRGVGASFSRPQQQQRQRTRKGGDAGVHSRQAYALHEGVDGTLQRNGVLRFNETIDM